jgi:hypothetical protein
MTTRKEKEKKEKKKKAKSSPRGLRKPLSLREGVFTTIPHCPAAASRVGDSNPGLLADSVRRP